MSSLVTFGIIIAAVALIREWVSSRPLSLPILLVTAGVVVGPDVLGLLTLDLDSEAVVLVAEATLAALLFADASRIDTTALRESLSIPARLLAIGLPLTIGMGTVVTALLLTDLSWGEAALVAAILAPTDAALGQAVVSNPQVPVRIRQALNVESGLNDGLAVPAITILAAVAVGDELAGSTTLIGEAIAEIALGMFVGAAAGIAIGIGAAYGLRKGLTDAEGTRLTALGGLAVGYGGAIALGGNGFIAAFACGLALRLVAGARGCDFSELAEDVGQLGASVTFVLFGSMMVAPALGVVSIPVVVCALATLTVGRLLPVRVAMLGTGLKPPTTLFLGWFGPRGLASMVFGLLIVAERPDGADDLFAVISLVILLSVVLHGITAAPGARRYGDWFRRQEASTMEESRPTVDMPIRTFQPPADTGE